MVIFQSTDWRDRPVVHAYRLGHPPRPPPPSITSKRKSAAPAVGIRSTARAARSRAPASRGRWVTSTGRSQCAAAGASVVLLTRTPLLILFTESLGVSFAVRIEEFLAALLPSCSEVGRCDVPIRPAFLGYGAEVLTELLQGRPTEKPVAIVDFINDKPGLKDNHMRDHWIVG